MESDKKKTIGLTKRGKYMLMRLNKVRYVSDQLNNNLSMDNFLKWNSSDVEWRFGCIVILENLISRTG